MPLAASAAGKVRSPMASGSHLPSWAARSTDPLHVLPPEVETRAPQVHVCFWWSARTLGRVGGKTRFPRVRQWLTILKDPRLGVGVGTLLAGAFAALATWIAWLVAPKVVPFWPFWLSVGVAAIGFVILLFARPEGDRAHPERPVVPPTNGQQSPPPPPTKRRLRLPTAEALREGLRGGPSRGADTTSSTPTHDGMR